MLNLLQKKTITVLSGLAVSFGAILVPANIVQAAVFELRIDGLTGSGEIGFDDESLLETPEYPIYISPQLKVYSGSQLVNGYFNWSFSGEGLESFEIFTENGFETVQAPTGVSLSSGNFDNQKSAFNNAAFIFDNGKLIGIDGYWVSFQWSGSSRVDSGFNLGLDSASFYYSGGFRGGPQGLGSSISINVSGAPTYSTILPWQNPNSSTEVPEPNTISASLIGVAFLLKKKNRSQPKNSQKSEKI